MSLTTILSQQTLVGAASFSWTPATADTGTNVVFTDTSTNSPTAWTWNFGTGVSRVNGVATTNPVVTGVGPHTIQWSTTGTKNVTLTTTGAPNSNAANSVLITAPVGGVVDFYWSGGYLNEAMSFFDISTTSPTSWSWNFGAGATPSTSIDQNPVFVTFSTPGPRNVGLTATPDGTTKVKSIDIVARPPGPFPSLHVEIAFTTIPNTLTPAYQDVTQYVQGVSIRRGRQHELDRVEAGTATFILDNSDRRFDPNNTASTYYPNVLPMRRIRITAAYKPYPGAPADVVYPIFAGFIENWPRDRGAGTLGKTATVQIEAVDAFAAMATVNCTRNPNNANELSGYPAERTSTRFERVLNNLGWQWYRGPASTIGEQLARFDFSAADAPTVLEHLQDITDTELGNLFLQGDGLIRFQTRTFRQVIYTKEEAILGDQPSGSTELPYRFVTPSYDANQVYNEVVISIPNAVETTLRSAISSIQIGIPITSGAGFPTTYPYQIDIEGEIITITSATSPTDLNTTAVNFVRPGGVSHPAGADVTLSTQVASDSASQTAYLTRTLSRDSQHASATDVLSTASQLLSRYKDPSERYDSVEILPGMKPEYLFPLVLLVGSGLASSSLTTWNPSGAQVVDLGAMITIRETPPGGGARIERDCYIEAIEHEIALDDSPYGWVTRYQLSPVDTQQYWVMAGTTTDQYSPRSRLGTTTRLGFP